MFLKFQLIFFNQSNNKKHLKILEKLLISFESNKRDISLPELVRGKLTVACRRWHGWVSRTDSALTHLSVAGNLLALFWRAESSQTSQTDGSRHTTTTSHQSTRTFTDNENGLVSVSLAIFLIQAVLTEQRLSPNKHIRVSTESLFVIWLFYLTEPYRHVCVLLIYYWIEELYMGRKQWCRHDFTNRESFCGD